ncbi:hypothetical protein OIC43_37170 [Streptomyces sp. NBC_00825]|uniref:hypothetical protein n=1 Tax=unclassified Streptomyces TaxID=2593676 RepID=UPI002ED188F4|nr:hypothetical protein OG832_06520 [Streptomyces sp. NBC_00826]WTH94269.1 hypothetical protein OIC43_37170 [Streptomyces sp. NBC_00825]WTI03004.1 hypothetical protein OHA23_37150 [Streptomyces sp. NBC_00822]
MTDRKVIETRVCIDDMLGPFDCKLNPGNRWNGWLSPYFTLDTTRELSAQTLRMADAYGYDCVDTIHVIDGRADSPDTVHIIEGGPSRDSSEPIAVAVRIRWRGAAHGAAPAATITAATPQVRKAARRRKGGGRGALRAVVLHVRWQYLDEDGDVASAANAVRPNPNVEGRYGIGGWEWTWHFAGWWCACGADWHEVTCTTCDLTRDTQPEKKPCDCGCDPEQGVAGEYDLESEASRAHLARTGRYLRWSESGAQPENRPCDCGCGALREGVRKAGDILRELVPNASAAGLIVEDGHPRLISVTADGAIVWTDDDRDSGPFDYERIGGADAVLHQALRLSTGPEALRSAGWKALENDKGYEAYAIEFPPPLPKK